MSKIIPLGIDISKKSFEVNLLKNPKRGKNRKFNNNREGYSQLKKWLGEQGVEKVHACLEATSIYGQELALYLHEQGQLVSIVNPLRIKGYGQGQLNRTKNDRADAGLIARFCRDLKPRAWEPSPEQVSQLQALSRRHQALQKMMTQEQNRLHLATDAELKAEIEKHIEFLEQSLEDLKKRMQAHIQSHEDLKRAHQLLTSITGIADTTATILLVEIGDITRFKSARQLAAFAGLTPQERTSGTSVSGKTRLCKIGNSLLRTALYFPAITAAHHCPAIQAFYHRLIAAGKPKMQAIGAVMHKLIRIVFGVLKSGKPFDPSLLSSNNTPVPLVA